MLVTHSLTMRTAVLLDVPRLSALITASVHGLGQADYTRAQIEAALAGAWGVDTQLIRDRTYFVVESEGEIVACGGWSWRRTPFGADQNPGRDSDPLDPELDAARIRAFFVHPAWARRGIGRALLERCEQEAKARGFRAAELVATLPGERLYRASDYQSGQRLHYPLPGDLTIEFVSMHKQLS